MKKKLFALAGFLGSLVSFAEGEITMDTTAAESIVTSAKNGLTTFLTNVTPTISAIILAGLAIWAAFVVIRLVKKAFSRAG